MSFASKYNKAPRFTIDTTGFKYASPADLYEQNGANEVYPLRAIFIHNKSQFGEQVVAATDKFYVNFPGYMLDTAREMLQDAEAIATINQGHAGFRIYPYGSHGKMCFGVEFVDM